MPEDDQLLNYLICNLSQLLETNVSNERKVGCFSGCLHHTQSCKSAYDSTMKEEIPLNPPGLL